MQLLAARGVCQRGNERCQHHLARRCVDLSLSDGFQRFVVKVEDVPVGVEFWEDIEIRCQDGESGALTLATVGCAVVEADFRDLGVRHTE